MARQAQPDHGCSPRESILVEPVSASEADIVKRHLMPLPHEISIRQKVRLSPERVRIRAGGVADGAERDGIAWLTRMFAEKANVEPVGDAFEILLGTLDSRDEIEGIRLEQGQRLREVPNPDQAYLVQPEGTDRLIVGGLTGRGVLYGAMTLCQLLEAGISRETICIPLVSIVDWPDFDVRGLWHMPLREIPWLSVMKLNEVDCATYFEVKPDREIEPLMAKNVEVDPEWSKPFARARRHGVEVVPGIIHMDFWEPRCAGFASTWPDMVGRGERAKAGFFEEKGFRAPCASNPRLVTILTELMAALASRGALDVSVWMSEYPGSQCECPRCMEAGQFQAEARAAVEAWRQVRRTHPDLRLRLFFGAGGFTPGDKWFPDYPPRAVEEVLATLPEEVRLCVSMGIRDTVLEDFAARGGLVTRCFVVSLAFWDFFACADIRNRMHKLHAAKMRGVSQYFDGRIEDVRGTLDLQLSALAEYAWNTHGRTIEQFGESWATRHGHEDPSTFGAWLSILSRTGAHSSSMEQLLWSGSWLEELAGVLKGQRCARIGATDPREQTIETCRTALEFSKYFAEKRLPLRAEAALRAIAFEAANALEDSIADCRKALAPARRFESTEPLRHTEVLLRYCELEQAGLALMDGCRADEEGRVPREPLARFEEVVRSFLEALHARHAGRDGDDVLRTECIADLERRCREVIASVDQR